MTGIQYLQVIFYPNEKVVKINRFYESLNPYYGNAK